MSQATENFFGMVIFVPLVSILLLFGACELVCNSVGYTLISDVVGPFDGSDNSYSQSQELAWLCAGFRRTTSGDWGYSGQYDHTACRELRDNCRAEQRGCDDWEHIQQGKIGWGEENYRWFSPIDEPFKHVDVALLVGDETARNAGHRRRSDRHQQAEILAQQVDQIRETTDASSVGRDEGSRESRSRAYGSDPINEIELALEVGRYRSARKLIKKFTAAAGVECEDAALLADQGGVKVAVGRLQRVLRDLARLQEVLSRPAFNFRGRARLGRKLDEVYTVLNALVQKMRKSIP